MASIKKWTLGFTPKCDKELKGLDKPVKQRIIDYLEDRVLVSENPRQYGKQLSGELSHLWSYRVGDYRVIADIQDDKLLIIAVSINHRREVYDI